MIISRRSVTGFGGDMGRQTKTSGPGRFFKAQKQREVRCDDFQKRREVRRVLGWGQGHAFAAVPEGEWRRSERLQHRVEAAEVCWRGPVILPYVMLRLRGSIQDSFLNNLCRPEWQTWITHTNCWHVFFKATTSYSYRRKTFLPEQIWPLGAVPGVGNDGFERQWKAGGGHYDRWQAGSHWQSTGGGKREEGRGLWVESSGVFTLNFKSSLCRVSSRTAIQELKLLIAVYGTVYRLTVCIDRCDI